MRPDAPQLLGYVHMHMFDLAIDVWLSAIGSLAFGTTGFFGSLMLRAKASAPPCASFKICLGIDNARRELVNPSIGP